MITVRFFGPYIKGTCHVEMHLHDSEVIELFVGEDCIHGKRFLFSVFCGIARYRICFFSGAPKQKLCSSCVT